MKRGETPSGDAGSSDAPGDSPTAVDGGADATRAPDDASSDGPFTFTIDCDDDVVAHWSMEEGTGIDIGDRCPLKLNGKVALLDGSAGWGTRGVSKSLELKGNAYVALGAREELQLAGPFTIAGFIRVDQTPDGYVGVYWNLGGKMGFEVVVEYDSLAYAQVGIADVTHKVDIGKIPTSKWTHLAFVFVPNTRMEVFRDGQSVNTSVPPSGPANQNSGEIRLGPVYDYATWQGALDDVVVYSRALTNEQIAALAKR